MASLNEIREARLKKLEQLKELNLDPYPAVANRDYEISQVVIDFAQLSNQDKNLYLAGRLISKRGQGSILFGDLDDGTDKIQLIFKIDEMSETDFENFKELIDTGDFLSVNGKLTLSKTGEKSMMVNSWTILTKSLRPLPEKWHGIKDEEKIYRQRYLDILTNEEVKEMFIKKAKYWKVIREFLESKGFMEVHTPTLELTTGGAETDPFQTHHNDFDIDVYLRISVGELWQKRLMAAGFPKTYEIGRVYRNEGSSPDHLQEFTNMEFYWAYANFEMGMELVKEMYRTIASQVFGKTQFQARGHTFDLASDWEKINYSDEIKRQTGIDIFKTTDQEIDSYLKSNGINHDAKTFERLVDVLWKKCRKNISGPAFITDYPDFMQPLAKRSSKNPKIVEQFQVLLGGAELGKGYSELNDPIDQKERFDYQQKLRTAGDSEAMMADYDFVEMLEHGMPPTCGFGVGERLFAYLMDKPIRETQLFPLMKPKTDN